MTGFRIKNRTVSFLIILAVYALAIFTAVIVFKLSSGMHLLMSTFLADIAATLVVWVSGVVFSNSSIYDPYWSVAPLVILLYWVISSEISLTAVNILFIAAAAIWGIRLTLNWAIRWKGLYHQDWRYTMFKKNSPRLWFFTNLVGINLMPTIIVFLALIPAYFGVVQQAELNFFSALSFSVCMAAVLIESVSDRQMDGFKRDRENKNKYIDRGLWRYSRHPNYFGEILFWWGIWLMQISVAPNIWVTVAGPVMVTLLFVFISIPLMEKHMVSSRPVYMEYCQKVPMLWPMTRKIN
jgi:steroid 5-alpha reductase family enzyme